MPYAQALLAAVLHPTIISRAAKSSEGPWLALNVVCGPGFGAFLPQQSWIPDARTRQSPCPHLPRRARAAALVDKSWTKQSARGKRDGRTVFLKSL